MKKDITIKEVDETQISGVMELIEKLFSHPCTPFWLKDALWEVVSEHTVIDAFDENYVRAMLQFTNFSDRKRRTK